jgi:hypothetical protein
LGGVLQHVAAAMPLDQREHTRIEGGALQHVAVVVPQLQHVAAVAPQHRLEQGQAQCGLAHVQALDRLAELAPQPAAAAPQHVAGVARQHKLEELAAQHCSPPLDKARNENDASGCVLQHAAAPLERLVFEHEDSDDEIDPDEPIPSMQVLKYQTLGLRHLN